MIENKNNINKFARSHRQFFFNLTISNYVYEMNFDQRVSFIRNEPFAPKKSDFKFIIQNYRIKTDILMEPTFLIKKNAK